MSTAEQGGFIADVFSSDTWDNTFDSINMTWNVAPMFYEALNKSGLLAVNKIYDDLNGKTGEVLLPVLTAAVEDMKARPDHYKAMNPVNGLGSYEGALGVMEKLRTWCDLAPEAVLRVS